MKTPESLTEKETMQIERLANVISLISYSHQE